MNALDHDDVERFITDGYVCLRGAFPSEIARQCVHELSAAANVDQDAVRRAIERERHMTAASTSEHQ